MKEFKPLTKEEIEEIRKAKPASWLHDTTVVDRALDELEFWRSTVAMIKHIGEEKQTAFLVAVQDWKLMGGILETLLPEIHHTASLLDVAQAGDWACQKCPKCQLSPAAVLPKTWMGVELALAFNGIICQCANGHAWRMVILR